MTAAAKVRMYVTVTALLGGCTAGLIMLVRTLLRPHGLPSWATPWATWLVGNRR
jgi:Ras family protein T1